MNKFKAKDIVIVSGQPHVWMTVNNVFGEGEPRYEKERVVCIWFDTKNRIQRETFIAEVLELAPIWNVKVPGVGGISNTGGQS